MLAGSPGVPIPTRARGAAAGPYSTVDAGEWFRDLDLRHSQVLAVFPSTPCSLSAEEREWAAGAKPAPTSPPPWADVTADLLREPARSVPWRAPAWDAGVGGGASVSGIERQHTCFWERVILKDNPHRRRLVSYLREGVDLRDFLREPYRGPSGGLPYSPDRFPGAIFSNRVPSKFARAYWRGYNGPPGEATHRGMLVSFLCRRFLSLHKCDLRPTTVQQYLGILCDSGMASFHIPQKQLDKLHALIRAALDDGWLSFRTLQRIAGECMSMTVPIRPAPLWTHALFQAIMATDESGVSGVHLRRDKDADLRGELRHWLGVASTTHEGPWQRARHFKAALTGGAPDASSVGGGGIVYVEDGPFRAGVVFPPDRLSKHINQKEMYALYHMLRQYCERHPNALRRAQVLINVDNPSAVGAFARGRAKNCETHALLVQLFDLQVQCGFLLSLNASAQRSPASGSPLPFFSHFDCPGAAGVDVLARDVAVAPGTVEEAFGFCFPPLVMVGHVIQHLAECKARAVAVVPDRQEYWFPLVRHAAVHRREVAPAAASGVFRWPCADDSLRPWQYSFSAMTAYEDDFRQ
ncbi:unnamed protein product [Ectocarpus sp. CCAP 1310/34]|nr:unnamed protein product [Ectocarpus sp. CCAP 1310/34]